MGAYNKRQYIGILSAMLLQLYSSFKFSKPFILGIMMSKQFLYVANWKLYFSYQEMDKWLKAYGTQLSNLAEEMLTHDAKLIVCPSFTSIHTVVSQYHDTPVLIGAQDCAPEVEGAYTGQESATTLASLGCTYCIIGHSEQRLSAYLNGNRTHSELFAEENRLIGQKAAALLENDITPILCIGETLYEREQQETASVLKSQLKELKHLPKSSLIIAYEPIWAIGSGVLPTNDEIIHEINFIKSCIESTNPGISATILYGGSITDQTSANLKEIDELDGFLIGKASTDFQELEKIVK